MRELRVLALCGSLRAASINRALLQAAAHASPEGMHVQLYSHLHQLPLFNPDLEAQMPAAAQALRDAACTSDGLLIASPEYAHGVSSIIKTALDWLVSDERFLGKPVALLNASPHSRHADPQLREILKTMSGAIVERASVVVATRGRDLSVAGILEDPALAASLRAAMSAFADAIRTGVGAETTEGY